jgi:hypothetical protein
LEAEAEAGADNLRQLELVQEREAEQVQEDGLIKLFRHLRWDQPKVTRLVREAREARHELELIRLEQTEGAEAKQLLIQHKPMVERWGKAMERQVARKEVERLTRTFLPFLLVDKQAAQAEETERLGRLNP